MRQKYPKLKILCLTVDNGFMSDVAMPNVRHVTRMFDVDLLVVKSYKDQFRAVLRKAFLDLNGRGGSQVVDHADGTLIFEIGMTVTRELGMDLMISGMSWVQLEQHAGVKSFATTEDGVTTLHPLVVWRPGEQEIRGIVRERQLILPTDVRYTADYFGGAKKMVQRLYDRVIEELFAKNIRSEKAFYAHAESMATNIYPAGH